MTSEELNYTVRIRKNDTGEIRSYEMRGIGPWDENSDFLWTEGNFGCDCNRSLFFQRAGGVPESEVKSTECGETAYTAIDATLPDGTVIPIDDED